MLYLLPHVENRDSDTLHYVIFEVLPKLTFLQNFDILRHVMKYAIIRFFTCKVYLFLYHQTKNYMLFWVYFWQFWRYLVMLNFLFLVEVINILVSSNNIIRINFKIEVNLTNFNKIIDYINTVSFTGCLNLLLRIFACLAWSLIKYSVCFIIKNIQLLIW